MDTIVRKTPTIASCISRTILRKLFTAAGVPTFWAIHAGRHVPAAALLPAYRLAPREATNARMWKSLLRLSAYDVAIR